MFCMSLMKEENRKAFKANEAEYLDRFPMTPEQREAILKRDWNRMLELGGNIYFTAKLGATDGHSFQHMAAMMTGSTQEEYAEMMLAGGRSVEGNRSKSARCRPRRRRRAKRGPKPSPAEASSKKRQTAKPARKQDRNVAKIIAGVTSSHVPAIGAALDNKQDRGALLEARLRRLREVQAMDGGGEARRRHRGLQRSRLGLLARAHPDLRARLRGANSRPPTKAGGRGRCRWSRAIRSSPRISPNR